MVQMKLMALACIVALAASIAAAEPGLATLRKEKRIGDCTLEAKSIDDCSPLTYAIRLAIFAAPGFIIATFYILSCPCYCLAKYCCNCCGGRNQTPNFCCPNDSLPARYSSGDILRPKVFTLLCLMTAIGAFVWGLIGTDRLAKGLNSTGEKIVATPDILQSVITDIDTALTVKRWDPATGTESEEKLLEAGGQGSNLKTEAEKNRDEFKSMIEDNMGDYKQYIDQAKAGLYVVFALPMALIALGALAAACNLRRVLPMTVVWLLFLIGILLWLGHSVFCATSMVLGDVCAEIQGLANKQMNVIAALLQCDDSMFSDFRNTFKQLEIEQSEATCNGLSNVCYDSLRSVSDNIASGQIYSCPANLDCTGKTFADLLTMMETAFYVHPNVVAMPNSASSGATCAVASPNNRCYIATCAEECRNNGDMAAALSTFGNTARQLYYNFIAARSVSNALDTLGAKFSTCDAVFSIIISPFSPPCDDLTSGTVYGRQASGLLGLCTLAGIFIFAWGAKRFISVDEAEKPQGENQVQDIKPGDLDGAA